MIDPPRARRPGPWRRPATWLFAALVLAAASLPGGLAAAHVLHIAPLVGVARPLATNPTFSVNLTDAPSYAPQLLSATVNGTVNVSVHLDNIGSITHTFTVVNLSQEGVVLNRSWTPQELSAYFATNGSLRNVSLASGQTAWANFSLPASTTFRSFEFVSTIPYQFQAGMWGFLNLTPAGPTFVLSDNATNSYQFVPSVLSAGPTAHGVVTLHVLVTNLGSLGHTFTVAPQPNVTLSSIDYFTSHVPLANASVPAFAGGSVWANFTVPGTGVYEFACTVTGHFAQGMYGFLYVGVPVPPPPATPSTAIVAVSVLAGSAVLLGVGLVLTLSSAFTGRLPKKPGSDGPHP